MRYLTVDELIYINEQVLGQTTLHTIVQGKRAVRDMGLLESAAARPQQSIFGADAFPTLPEKAAALLHAIARAHPFADGNKRTATLAMLFTLEANGLTADWDPAQALVVILAVAEGKQTAEALAEWLPTRPTTPLPEPDAARDMAVIARLMTNHNWLLDELAGR